MDTRVIISQEIYRTLTRTVLSWQRMGGKHEGIEIRVSWKACTCEASIVIELQLLGGTSRTTKSSFGVDLRLGVTDRDMDQV